MSGTACLNGMSLSRPASAKEGVFLQRVSRARSHRCARSARCARTEMWGMLAIHRYQIVGGWRAGAPAVLLLNRWHVRLSCHNRGAVVGGNSFCRGIEFQWCRSVRRVRRGGRGGGRGVVVALRVRWYRRRRRLGRRITFLFCGGIALQTANAIAAPAPLVVGEGL